MAVPKRRHTKGRRDKRRAGLSAKLRKSLEQAPHGVNHRLKRYYQRMQQKGGE